MIVSLLILVGLGVTITVMMNGDPDYKGALVNPLSKSTTKQIGLSSQVKQDVLYELRNYYKDEEQTYLTLPEWYLVFNPKEYADYLIAGNNPSDFPFFGSIKEYWKLYDRVIILTKDVYPENSQYKIILFFIGVSATAQYMTKGLYEGTIGRFTYWTVSGSTPEDRLIQLAHKAYSNFIYSEPWHKFPFFKWIDKIWTDTPFFGANVIRKLERKIFFTLEFGFKSVYAKLMGYGAQTSNKKSDKLVKMHVIMDPKEIVKIDNRVKIVHDFGNNNLIISVPHWGEFTEIIPKLANAGVDFIEISGNDDILVTITVHETKKETIQNAQFLFRSRIMTGNHKNRLVYSVKVNLLTKFINALNKHDMVLEHIYDY